MFQQRLAKLREDPLLRRVIRNSSYLFSSSAISAVLSVIQMIYVVRLLDPAAYGLATGVIMVFATSVNQLLSFRMSEVVVKYAGEALALENKNRAAALIKGIGITEAITSIVAYVVLVALAPLAAQAFAKNPATTPLFIFYGLFLIANLVYETSVGTLQTFHQFSRVARSNFFQSMITFLSIFTVSLWGLGIFGILVAYLVGKTVAGLMVTGYAIGELKRNLGEGWWKIPVRTVQEWKSIVRFMVSTNLNGTINLVARDNIPLYIAYLLSATEVGYFKFALNLINFVRLPIEPFIWPTYAEITRTIAQRQWEATRKLLKQVSSIAGIWTLLTGGGLIALGWWLIPFIFGEKYVPAYPALVILLVGFGCANILNWNRPLLLALGRPRYPVIVAATVGAVELILFFLLVPRSNYLVASAVFSGYLLISVLWMVWRGLAIIIQEETS